LSKISANALDASAYYDTLTSAANRGIGGGRTYDALLLRCARDFEADTIFTWNVKHLRQIAPDLADRIQTPPRTVSTDSAV